MTDHLCLVLKSSPFHSESLLCCFRSSWLQGARAQSFPETGHWEQSSLLQPSRVQLPLSLQKGKSSFHLGYSTDCKAQVQQIQSLLLCHVVRLVSHPHWPLPLFRRVYFPWFPCITFPPASLVLLLVPVASPLFLFSSHSLSPHVTSSMFLEFEHRACIDDTKNYPCSLGLILYCSVLPSTNFLTAPHKIQKKKIMSGLSWTRSLF